LLKTERKILHRNLLKTRTPGLLKRSLTKTSSTEKAGKRDSFIRKVLKVLGPGLVTGAADDDPSGIATYSSVGAQYGYSMLWTMLFIYPFMAAIQEISGRLGRITGRGIAGNIHRFYPQWALYSIVSLLLLANIINIGADIGAMGAAVNLLIGGPALIYCVAFAVISVVLQVFIPYKTYSAVLKCLTLSLFAYVGTVFVTQVIAMAGWTGAQAEGSQSILWRAGCSNTHRAND
jgi:NRAMP (natural resistance-associated macrophage protein)-like metal ion transporter